MNLKAITAHKFIDLIANRSARAIGIHLHAFQIFKLQHATECKRALLAYRDDELMGNYGFETKARLAFLLGGENDVIFVVFQAFNKIERETLRYAELYRFTEVVVIGTNKRRQIIAVMVYNAPTANSPASLPVYSCIIAMPLSSSRNASCT